MTLAKRTFTSVIFCLLLATPALGGYNEGRAAYWRGDYAMALREFRPLAGQGDSGAQYYLGQMYKYGRGVTQDYAEAVKWYRKAAEQGNALAQYNLGGMYNNSKGVPRDHVQAHKWYNLAATLGFKPAENKRNAVASSMTPADISEAQKLAEQWYAAYQERKKK